MDYKRKVISRLYSVACSHERVHEKQKKIGYFPIQKVKKNCKWLINSILKVFRCYKNEN
jgi:hypothetical protein